MAILYNLTTSTEQAAQVSEGLEKNWVEIGAVAPELPDNVSPFISGLEVSLCSGGCREVIRPDGVVGVAVGSFHGGECVEGYGPSAS